MSPKAVNSVLIYGSGYAFESTLAALANNLPQSIDITAVRSGNSQAADMFYGHVSSPSAYGFHRLLGLEEKDILMETKTSFSFGTAYRVWANQFNWVQSHHLPFPVWDNIRFHQYLIASKSRLEPYLIGSLAGLRGVFAHPPLNSDIPLSRAEYGYQYHAADIASYLSKKIPADNVTRLDDELQDITLKGTRIKSLQFKKSGNLQADLYIDCSGPDGKLISLQKHSAPPSRRLCAVETILKRPDGAPTVRQLVGKPFGWQSEAYIQGEACRLSVFHPDDEASALTAHGSANPGNIVEFPMGKRSEAWLGNCVGIGHSASVLEPLTPAPFLMLQRDIERLIALFPMTSDMLVEAREYNRLFDNDFEHAYLFNRALFEISSPPDVPYWNSVLSGDRPEKLLRKVTQFESRGYLTAFDLEPFNEQDWAILHFGMGRIAKRHDIYLDKIPANAIQNRLEELRQNIERVVQKMPPGDKYLQNYKNYLKKNNDA